MPLTKDDIQSQLAASRKVTEAFQAQLDARQAKEDEVLAQDAADVRTASMVLSAMSKIPVPKDGKNGRDADPVDYEVIQEYVDAAVDALPKAIDGKRGPAGKPGKDAYTPVKGVDYYDGIAGKNADDKAILDSVLAELAIKSKETTAELAKILKEDTAFVGPMGPQGIQGESIKGDPGESITGPQGPPGESVVGDKGDKGDKGDAGESIIGPQGSPGYTPVKGVDYHDGSDGKPGESIKGKQGARGKKGDSGTDGVGIKNVYTEGTALKIALTDGKTKTLSMPVSKGAAPIAPPPVQWAKRTPVKAEGIISENVSDALVELKNKIVQSSVGNPFDAGTPEAFMFTFNPYDETHDGSFVYDVNNKLISKTIETAADVVLYTVTFSYNVNQLSSKTISDNINGDSVTVTFEYDENNRLIGKAHTYTA